jgi:hypothetical protein
MRAELNDLIRAIVDTRFAIENVADCVIRDMRQGHDTKYRGHVWNREHLEAMEKVYLGIEAAWQYAKWLQFPEMESRQKDGFAALSRVMDVQEIFNEIRLTDSEFSVASPAAIGRSSGSDGKEIVMARTTVADLEKIVEELQEQLDQHIENLNNEIVALEERVDGIEESGDQRKKRGRQMSEEERKAAGERMQMGRAKKLGLDSIEQLHALKLRPGEKPTKAQIKKVKEEFPVS